MMNTEPDTDTYFVGIDQYGQPIEGEVGRYLDIVAPMAEAGTGEYVECIGACLESDPGLGPTATDEDFDDFIGRWHVEEWEQ